MRTLTALLLIPLAGAFAAELPTEHTVQTKDTMWDLAGQYYHDHFQWRRIAEANPPPKVHDPHWIYPKQILRIPALEEAPAPTPAPQTEEAPAAEQTPQAVPEQEPPPPQKLAPPKPPKIRAAVESEGSLGGEGIAEDFPDGEPAGPISAFPFAGRFKAKDGWKADGVIVEDVRDGEHMASEGDPIEFTLSPKGAARAGDDYDVFRRAAAIDTEADQKALYLARIGRVRVTGSSGGRIQATVTDSRDSLQPGDWVKRAH